MADEAPPQSAFLGAILEHGARVADALHPGHIKRTTEAINTELEQIEGDLSAFVTPLLTEVMNHPDVDERVKGAVSTLLAPEHQSQLVIVAAAAYALVREFVSAAIAPYVQAVSNAAWSMGGNQTIPLSPPQIAAAMLKGGTSPGGVFALSVDPTAEAAMSGLSAARLQDLYHLEGQSFGLETALLLQRRGQLVGVNLTDVLEYSNLNPAFYASAANAIYLPPSVSEVLHGVRTGWLDPTDGMTYFGYAGIDPATHFDWMLNATGHPLSFGELANLYNRQIIDAPAFQLGAQRGNLHPDYAQYLPDLAVHFPAVYQVLELVKTGAMTAERATTILGYEGFQQVDIDSIVAEFNTTTTAKVKELSYSQITNAYESGLITAPEATVRLTALKYDAPTITLILELADNARVNTAKNATVRAIGTRYVAGKITKANAMTLLGEVPIAAALQNELLTLWDLEITTAVRLPSESMIVGAYRRGVITAADCYNRLVALGVRVGDISIVVADGYPPTKSLDAQTAAAEVQGSGGIGPGQNNPFAPA